MANSVELSTLQTALGRLVDEAKRHSLFEEQGDVDEHPEEHVLSRLGYEYTADALRSIAHELDAQPVTLEAIEAAAKKFGALAGEVDQSKTLESQDPVTNRRRRRMPLLRKENIPGDDSLCSAELAELHHRAGDTVAAPVAKNLADVMRLRVSSTSKATDTYWSKWTDLAWTPDTIGFSKNDGPKVQLRQEGEDLTITLEHASLDAPLELPVQRFDGTLMGRGRTPDGRPVRVRVSLWREADVCVAVVGDDVAHLESAPELQRWSLPSALQGQDLRVTDNWIGQILLKGPGDDDVPTLRVNNGAVEIRWPDKGYVAKEAVKLDQLAPDDRAAIERATKAYGQAQTKARAELDTAIEAARADTMAQLPKSDAEHLFVQSLTRSITGHADAVTNHASAWDYHRFSCEMEGIPESSPVFEEYAPSSSPPSYQAPQLPELSLGRMVALVVGTLGPDTRHATTIFGEIREGLVRTHYDASCN